MNAALHNAAQVVAERGPRGGALDTAWPRTPVAHLAFETDAYFTTIHCPFI